MLGCRHHSLAVSKDSSIARRTANPVQRRSSTAIAVRTYPGERLSTQTLHLTRLVGSMTPASSSRVKMVCLTAEPEAAAIPFRLPTAVAFCGSSENVRRRMLPAIAAKPNSFMWHDLKLRSPDTHAPSYMVDQEQATLRSSRSIEE